MKPRPPVPTAADLADEIRALPAVRDLAAANDNLAKLEAELQDVAATLADESARACSPNHADEARRAEASSLVVGAPRIASTGPAPMSPATLAGLKDRHAVLRAAIRQQKYAIANNVGPEAARAVSAHVRPHKVADLKRRRDAVLAFDASLVGTTRVRDALEAVGILGMSGAPLDTLRPFDAERSGADGLTVSERIEQEIRNLERFGVSFPAPQAPAATAKKPAKPAVEEVVY